MTDRSEAFEWYVRGFLASAEGGNAEYPHGFDEGAIRDALAPRFAEEWDDAEDGGDQA